MQPPQQHSWINLVDIKSQLIKKLGLERSKQYLNYLNRFLSLKLGKAEFDKLCLRTLGKDNVRLHNQLIRSALKNACTKASFTINDDPSKTVGNKKPLEGVYQQNGSVTSPLTLTNGDILPPSPRKARTGARDRRVMDRKSALRPNGMAKLTSFSSPIPQSDDIRGVLENGDPSSPNHQELMQRAENEQTESLDKKDEKRESGSRRSLHAPLGVPYCPVSIGAVTSPLGNSSKNVGELHVDGLLDTTTLKERMEQITAAHGLQHVSLDCANVMNSGLDVYLKGLIRSCTQLHEVRSVYKPTKSGPIKYPTHIHPLNGVRQNGGWPLNVTQAHEPKPKRVVTLLDFRVAMELNSKQLGEDQPILLEKICTHNFVE